MPEHVPDFIVSLCLDTQGLLFLIHEDLVEYGFFFRERETANRPPQPKNV